MKEQRLKEAKATLKKVIAQDLFVMGSIEVDHQGLLSLEDWDRVYRMVNK